MADREPSTSNSNDVEFDDEFIEKAKDMTIDQLKEQLQLLESGNHPLLRTVRNQRAREQQKQAERLQDHKERAIRKVEEDYERKEAEIRAEFEARVVKLQEEAKARSIEMEKSVIADYGVIDINKPVAIPVMYDTNKKTLRGRGGGQLIEPANYFNQNQSSKIPEFNLKLAFDDLRIRQDLAAITDQSGERRFPRSTVVISKPRVIIDGKTFKQGEELLVSNSSNEPFLAKMEYVNERMITFKAAKNWDIRQITATQEDLEDGRVIVAKKSSG